MRILHISDFHLDNINDTSEHLRVKFYKEYLSELASKIHSEIGSIDYIFATGDFVNKNKIGNFSHAKLVIEYIAKKLGLNNNSVAVCIGNHDFSQELDQKKKHKNARLEFYKFQDSFSKGNIVKQNNHTILYKFKNLMCLSLDATWETGNSNVPRSLSKIEIDEIVNDFIIEEVPTDSSLIVLSHYPMVHFNRSLMYVEEKDWETKHEWKDGYYLVERIFKLRPKHQTFYLFGDGHIPDFMSYNHFTHFVMSAMLGCGCNTIPKMVSREAKIIEFETTKEPTIHTYKYKMRGYGDNPQIGDWVRTESQIRLQEKNPLAKANISTQLGSEIELESKTLKKPIVISTSLQDKIIKRIAQYGLYSLDRYATSNSHVSLSWIYVNKLLNEPTLFAQVINRINKWFEEKILGKQATDNFVFIGIDFWGSILASQVSIKTNVKSYCIASKAGANHHTYKESVNFLKTKKHDFSNVKNIIFFTDVIATGETLHRKKIKIEEVLNFNFPNWYVVSIIADKEQNRLSNLDSFKEIATFCSEIRTPVLHVSKIPSEAIVPPRLDLRIENINK